MTDDTEDINWLHPDLLETVKGLVPDEVKQINAYTYEIFGATFMVAGDNTTAGAMIGWLVDNGWRPESEGQS